MLTTSRVVAHRTRLTEDSSEFQSFRRFVEFCQDLLNRPDVFAGVDCGDSYKAYVPKYYRAVFGNGSKSRTSRQLKWFRRMELILTLPAGSTIVDYGGGYGLDSVFLSSVGYRVIFYDITPNHVAIASFFRAEWERKFSPLQMQAVLGTRDVPYPFERADALLFNEVAHHIEPPTKAFQDAARILTVGGHLFLLEPNYLCLPTQLYFFRVRGIRTVVKVVDPDTGQEMLYGNEHIRPAVSWIRMVEQTGFELSDVHYVVPWFLRAATGLRSSVRRLLETMPGAQQLLASHITYHFRRK